MAHFKRQKPRRLVCKPHRSAWKRRGHNDAEAVPVGSMRAPSVEDGLYEYEESVYDCLGCVFCEVA